MAGIQDGLKSHWAPASRAAMDENRVTFLANFPVRSPDLNPIENLFPHIDKYIAEQQRLHGDAQTKAIFMQRVRDAFSQPDMEARLLNLADSMPGRLQKCIELEGHHTGY